MATDCAKFNRGVLDTIHKAVQVGITCPTRFFRGHAVACGSLIPSIHRERWDVHRVLHSSFELKLVLDFRRSAVAFDPHAPGDHNYLSWLFRMQHHNAPTRLLDWSESIFTALFFAVRDEVNRSVDGELWVLNPELLNQQSIDTAGRAYHRDPRVRYLAAEPFHSNPPRLLKNFRLKERPNGPIAFLPPYTVPRMVAQSSAFTIHPQSSPPIDLCDLFNEPCELGRYVIPAGAKAEILHHLTALGITERLLFPDLDGVSAGILRAAGMALPERVPPPDFRTASNHLPDLPATGS